MNIIVLGHLTKMTTMPIQYMVKQNMFKYSYVEVDLDLFKHY